MKIIKKTASIRTRMIVGYVCLFLLWAAFLLIIVKNYYLSNAQTDNYLAINESFSSYYLELNNTGTIMYHYMTSARENRGDFTAEFEKSADRLMDAAGELYTKVPNPVATDFYFLVQSYTDRMRDAIQDSGSEEKLDYSSGEELRQNILNGYAPLWRAVHSYTENGIRDIHQSRKHKMCLYVFITILGVAGTFLYILTVSRRLVAPILSMTRTVMRRSHQIEERSQRMNTAVMRNDEMKVLAVSLYQLIDQEQLRFTLMKKNEEMEQKVQEQELKAARMESQLHMAQLQEMRALVNPHFLFNTLGVISNLSLEEHAEETSRAITNLSSFLRYSLASRNRTVAISEEVDQLCSYFDILNLRFPGRFQFEIQMDPEITSMHIPSVIFQPMVENSLSHGVGSYRTGGKISCIAERKDSQISLRVEDNGVGMTQEEIHALQQRMKKGLDADLSHGIGLTAVYYRLQDCFSGKCVMNVQSRPGVCTAVEFLIPAGIVLEGDRNA